MELLALIAAIVCALVALIYALPLIAFSVVSRALARRFNVRPALLLLVASRLRWTPVLLWGAAAVVFLVIAFAG